MRAQERDLEGRFSRDQPPPNGPVAAPVNIASGAGQRERTHRLGAVRAGWLRLLPAWLDPVLVAVLAVAVSLAGASRPSFWFDEAATISASHSRSLPELWPMLGHVDAVHGSYYLLMHGWFSVFPPTEFWSRVPSGLAIGGAAAGLVMLAKRFSPRSVALCCGVVFAVLPRTTWAGIEARPYALDAMAAVWLSVLLVHAARRAKVSVWLAYGVVLVVSTLLDVYLVLMILVYACFIGAVGRSKTVVVPFAITSVVAVGVVSPFVMVVIGQADQIHCCSIQRQTVVDVGVRQYFGGVPLTLLAALVIAASIVLWLRDVRRPAASERELLILSVGWMAIPTAAIVVFSAGIIPIYTSKYLSFTAPGMALMLGMCIVAVASTPKRSAALVAAFAVAAIPNYLLTQRGPYAKSGMDYSQVADLITHESAPGDCLLLDDTVTWKFRPARALMAARPAAYRSLVDVGLWEHASTHRELFDTNLAPFVVADRISRCRVLWVIAEHDPILPAHQQGPALPPGPRFGRDNAFWVPHDLGFRLVERWQFNLAQVIKETR